MPEPSRAFERLHPRVQRWIWQEKWDELRDVQEAAVAPILAEKSDVIVMAATAGGKTEAAFLPICSRLVGDVGGSIRALYVGPLKALINDQFRRLDGMCEHLEIPVHRWHGDVNAAAKRELLTRPSGVLLITPESLEALFVLRGPHVAKLLGQLNYVVIDELHAFIGTERGRQLQSLLHRVEIAVRRRIPRIGLSATLGDRATAAEFLRPRDGASVLMIESTADSGEIRMQLRGYRATAPAMEGSDLREAMAAGRAVELEELVTGDRIAISEHLFAKLRGQDNLIFANARTSVEQYADLLRRMSERQRVPNEFFPHHGNLAKDLREDVERLLKDRNRPLSAVCTSTLELGIDIGSVSSVAQIGAPPSVAALRQRLGRSGRRAGEAAVLRMYVAENEVTEKSAPQDSIHPELMQSIAMLNLLLERWYEPPLTGALHLSTLVQQVLSLIAQHGGVRAKEAWVVLCKTGPFGPVDPKRFAILLRALGQHELVSQATDGTLLLGAFGERIVNHYGFYSAFATDEEYRLVTDGRALGTLPIDHPIGEGQFLIFAGQRWRVVGVDAEHKVVDLVPAPGGILPLFAGTGAPVHDRVRQEMLRIYQSGDLPVFLDSMARDLLKEGRANFARLRLSETAIIANGSQTLFFPWVGSRAMNTIFLQLHAKGIRSCLDGVAIAVVDRDPDQLREAFREIVDADPADGAALAACAADKFKEKYDTYLPEDLLCADYASRALDPVGAWNAIRRSIEPESRRGPALAPRSGKVTSGKAVPKVVWSTREWARVVAELPTSGLLPSRTVLVPRERVAHALRREIVRLGRSECLVGTRFITPGLAAREVLAAAGRRFSTGETALRSLRIRQVFSSGKSFAHYPIELLRNARGWDEAFGRALDDLEHAGMRSGDLPRTVAPQLDDLDLVWVSVDEQANTSWTLSRLLLEAADVLEQQGGSWPFVGPVLAVIDADTSAAEARFLQAIPEIALVVAGARPVREHYLQRLEVLFGGVVSDAVSGAVAPRGADRELDLLRAFLFERPEVLAGERRPRSPGPDGTVHFEEHPGVEAEIEATADWVTQQIVDATPLEDIAVLLPKLDPMATMLVSRLQRLPWAEGTLPIFVASGLPVRGTAAGARFAALIQALRAGLSAESLAAVLPAFRIADGPKRHLSSGAALDLVYSMGTVGGTAANLQGGLVWETLLQQRESALALQIEEARQLQADEERTRIARNVRDLERILEDLRGVRPAVSELVSVLRAVADQEHLAALWQRLRRFCDERLLLPGDGASLPSVVAAALQEFVDEPACAALKGVDALEVIERTVESLRLPTARFGEPAIYVGTVADAVGIPFRSVRILGLSEGALPSVPAESPVLPSSLRGRLPALVSSPADRALSDLHRLDRIVRDTEGAIVFSASRTNTERTEREPSSIFIEAAAALGRPDRVTERKGEAVPDVTALRRDGFEPARTARLQFRESFCLEEVAWLDRVARERDRVPQRWRQVDGSLDVARIRDLLTSDEWTPLDGILGANSGYPMPGLSTERPVSASRLRTLLQCPHQFLLESVLGWTEPSAPPSLREIDALPYGSLFHRVVERFFAEHGGAFAERQSTLDDWLRIVDTVASAAFTVFCQEYPLVGDPVRKQQLNRLRRDVQTFVRSDWNAPMRRFVAVERSFGVEQPMTLQFGDVELHLRGYIDRIDVEGNRTLVRDLKTGRSHPRRGREANPDPVRDLQIAVYGMVTRQLASLWSVPADIAAAYAYTDVRGEPERAFRTDFGDLETEARGWMRVAGTLLRGGLFPRTPLEKDCEYCSFQPVCGRKPHERSRHLLMPADGPLGGFRELKERDT